MTAFTRGTESGKAPLLWEYWAEIHMICLGRKGWQRQRRQPFVKALGRGRTNSLGCERQPGRGGGTWCQRSRGQGC